MTLIGNDWDSVLGDVFSSDDYARLTAALDTAYAHQHVLPGRGEVFNALRLTPFADVKVVIIGQDPYHTPEWAHGLAFSVRRGVRVPPSLSTVYKELSRDVGFVRPAHGCLEDWARRGVLLLNTVLTVEAAKPRAHAGIGWQAFTGAILAALNKRAAPAVFMLWGKDAEKTRVHINAPCHLCLTAAHPSPLARGKFIGCGHFSKTNEFLRAAGIAPVDWTLS